MARGSVSPPPGFGGETEPQWDPSAEHDPVMVLSTHTLHRVLAAVRQAWPRVYPDERFSGQALAGKLGGSVRPVQKRLAGDPPLTLADVLTLAALFGKDILEALPRNEADLFPTPYRRMLNHWKPGAGLLPTFVEQGAGAIDWAITTHTLAAYDARETQHLLTADTYRYELAAILGTNGVPANHLEYTEVSIEHSRAMTLFTKPRTAIIVADLRELRARQTAAATLMRILYQTVEHDIHEPILVLIAGPATTSQIEVHLPAALHSVGERITVQFQHAVEAGLDVDDAHQLLPDIELTTLGNAAGASDQNIVALRVGK
jgi:hypothetical protein